MGQSGTHTGPEMEMSSASLRNRRKFMQGQHGMHRHVVWDETGCWIKIFGLKWQRFRMASQAGVFEVTGFFQHWPASWSFLGAISPPWILPGLQMKRSQSPLASGHLLLSWQVSSSPSFPQFLTIIWSSDSPLRPGHISDLGGCAYSLTSIRPGSTLR